MSKSDFSLFIYNHDNIQIFVYVDNILIMGRNNNFTKQLINDLGSEFDNLDLRPLSYFLGIKACRPSKGMILC